jgi:hypothetical protein
MRMGRAAKRGARRVLEAIGIVLALSAVLGPRFARATMISYPPVTGDRKVEFTWPPDRADSTLIADPYFTGNTLLRVENVFDQVHGVGHAVRSMQVNAAGTEVYSWAEGESVIRHWSFASGASVAPDDLPLADGPPPLSNLSLHSLGAFLLAGLSSGEVAFFRLHETLPTETLYPAGASPILNVQFFPNSPDTLNQQFVTVGEDDSVHVFLRPGQLLSLNHVMYVNDGASGALAVSPSRTLIAAGTEAGRIFVWEVAQPLAPHLIIGDEDAHPGPVERIVWSPDSKLMATADPTGQVRIWRPSTGEKLAQFETGVAGTPFLEFSPPFGRLLFVGLPDGRLEIRTGRDGVIQKSATDVGVQGLTAMTRNSEPASRLLMGDANGRITRVRAGTCTPTADEPRCFGGYMVWRSPSTDLNDTRLTRLRLYTFGDSTWTFKDSVRAFSDPDSIIKRIRPEGAPVGDEPIPDIVLTGPHDGVPYYYAVTRFDLVYLEGGIFEVFPQGADAVFKSFYRDPGQTEPTPIVAEAGARKDTPLLDHVYVVPNPYEKGKVPWDAVGGPHLEFRNLPEVAVIKIYTISGDFVRRLDHRHDRYDVAKSTESWDLQNSDGKTVASGVYVYQVRTPSGEVIEGYMAVVL